MTCIVGLETEDGVYIGGDSAASDGWGIQIRDDAKVFTRGPYAFGFTSSYRMGQLLRYTGDLPEPSNWDVDRFMVAEFIPAVKSLLEEGGWLKNESGVVEGGTFLVGVGTRLYAIQDDFQIARGADGYEAVGSGSDYAVGALYATQEYEFTPEERITLALEAAEHHSSFVRAPFHIVSPLEDDNEEE